MTLIDRILQLAALWAVAKGHASTARLSTIVANGGGLLKRLERGGNTTVATLDKFALFLREPMNWPGGIIPIEAIRLLEEIGHITTPPEAVTATADMLGRVHEGGDTGADRSASASKSNGNTRGFEHGALDEAAAISNPAELSPGHSTCAHGEAA